MTQEIPLAERSGYFPLLDTEHRTTVPDDLLHAADARGIQTRTWRAVEGFLETVPDTESVVIVTHGWGVPTITAALLGVTLDVAADYFPATAFGTNAALCSVTRLFRAGAGGAWELDETLTNSVAHLAETGEVAAAANASSDPSLSLPFERAAAIYYSGQNTPWPTTWPLANGGSHKL